MYYLIGMCQIETREYLNAHDAFNSAIRVDQRSADVSIEPLYSYNLSYLNLLPWSLALSILNALFHNYMYGYQLSRIQIHFHRWEKVQGKPFLAHGMEFCWLQMSWTVHGRK